MQQLVSDESFKTKTQKIRNIVYFYAQKVAIRPLSAVVVQTQVLDWICEVSRAYVSLKVLAEY